MKRKFKLGQMLSTISVLELCKHEHSDLGQFIDRHVSGDWGDVTPEDRAANDLAVLDGGRIVSVYQLDGVRISIVTDADRLYTVAKLFSEH